MHLYLCNIVYLFKLEKNKQKTENEWLTPSGNVLRNIRRAQQVSLDLIFVSVRAGYISKICYKLVFINLYNISKVFVNHVYIKTTDRLIIVQALEH